MSFGKSLDESSNSSSCKERQEVKELKEDDSEEDKEMKDQTSSSSSSSSHHSDSSPLPQEQNPDVDDVKADDFSPNSEEDHSQHSCSDKDDS